MRPRQLFLATVLFSMAAPLVAQSGKTSGGAIGRDQFATVGQIRLHYADWGGSGEAMVFLTGGGNGGAHSFDSFAPQFTDRYHVLGLTRRGTGQSDKPESGYDTKTLAKDVSGFLDAVGLDRAIVVGYSIAGAEMTRFAADYPNRVRALVYLDAVVDYARIAEISAQAHFTGQGFNETAQIKAIQDGAAESHPDYTKIGAPALAFVETCAAPPQSRTEDDPTYKRYLQLLFNNGVWWESIRQFRAEMKNGTLIEMPDCNHAFLFDPQQGSRAAREMRDFLSKY
jgi:pimeloyl-ACP methyl ester carboxylesterase